MNKSKTIEVVAAICPKCLDRIYSRATHDYRQCSCGEIAIDGGFDYLRLAYKEKSPETIKLNVLATEKQLYDDWNLGKNKYGLIKANPFEI